MLRTGDPTRHHYLEPGTAPEVAEAIRDRAKSVMDHLRRVNKETDCGYASAEWVRVFRHAGIRCVTIGGPGDERAVFQQRDGSIKPHVWLFVGPDMRIFDSTASQFDDGGVRLEGYWVDWPQRRMLDWRDSTQGRSWYEVGSQEHPRSRLIVPMRRL